MKRICCFVLLLWAIAASQISAQETGETDTLPGTPLPKTYYELFGRRLSTSTPSESGESPALQKGFVRSPSLKLDLAPLVQTGFMLELEQPITPYISLIARTGWQKLNRKLPYNRPGTYQQTVVKTSVHSNEIFGFFYLNSKITYSPEAYREVGSFLPTSMIPLEGSFRLYIFPPARRIRFFFQPGARILHLRGLHVEDHTAYIYPSSSSGVEKYRLTRTTRAGARKTSAGLTGSLGVQFRGPGAVIGDLGLQAALNAVGNDLSGLKIFTYYPVVNIGIRF